MFCYLMVHKNSSAVIKSRTYQWEVSPPRYWEDREGDGLGSTQAYEDPDGRLSGAQPQMDEQPR